MLSEREHQYERFAPVGGVRPFVVGTAGAASYLFRRPPPGSQVRLSGVPGVLVLDLAADGYGWRFVGLAGRARDRGRG